MSTVLDAPSAPAERLQTTMTAVRLSFTWLGTRKTLSQEQKAEAADTIRRAGKNDWENFLLYECLDAYFPLDGRELGRGLIAYAYADAVRIIGKKSSEIADILGFEGRDTLIHRDDMALHRK